MSGNSSVSSRLSAERPKTTIAIMVTTVMMGRLIAKSEMNIYRSESGASGVTRKIVWPLKASTAEAGGRRQGPVQVRGRTALIRISHIRIITAAYSSFLRVSGEILHGRRSRALSLLPAALMVTDVESVVNDCTSSVVELTTPAGTRMFEFLSAEERGAVLHPFVRALALDACASSSQRARDVVERAAALADAARRAGVDVTDLLGRVARLVFITERRLGELRPEFRQDRAWRAHWHMLDEMSTRACIYAFSREAFSSDGAWNKALDTIASNPAGAAPRKRWTRASPPSSGPTCRERSSIGTPRRPSSMAGIRRKCWATTSCT